MSGQSKDAEHERRFMETVGHLPCPFCMRPRVQHLPACTYEKSTGGLLDRLGFAKQEAVDAFLGTPPGRLVVRLAEWLSRRDARHANNS